jgi:hypothetical protein
MKERGGLSLFPRALGSSLLDKAGRGFPWRFGVFAYTKLVGGAQGAGQDVFGGGGEPDVGHAHATPAAVNGEEDFWEFCDEVLLLFGGKHQVAVALLGGGQGGEDAAVDAEIGIAHVGGFFGAGERESDAAEVVEVHGEMVQPDWEEEKNCKSDRATEYRSRGGVTTETRRHRGESLG